MKRFPLILLLLLVAGTAAAAASPSRQPRGVPRRVTAICDSAIDYRAEPYAEGKVLFGRLGVPSDDHVLQSVRQGWARPFHYVTKFGFEIKAGTAVDIRVSPTWHSRMTVGGASSIRFLRCTSPAETPWIAYANLFTVKNPACVSLIATVGGQSTRFRVPLGRPCPPLAPPSG